MNQSLYKSWSGAGVDVGSQRTDDLDKLCLEHLGHKSVSSILDIGCGQGGQALRMAQAGALVTAIDSYDFAAQFATLRAGNNLTEKQLRFVQTDAQLLFVQLGTETFDDVLLQRTLHYLPYAAACQVLADLQQRVEDRLFISVTGLDSAIGRNYLHSQRSVENRFCELTPEQAGLFSITQPVCLYSQSEFITVLQDSGWQVQACWESAFGNLKAVCTH